MPASTRGRASFALLALVTFVSGLSAVPAHAQEKATIYASVLVSDNSLAGRPVMVSFIRDGGIFFQEETITTESPNVVSVGSQDSPVGVYDVRVEGDGIGVGEGAGTGCAEAAWGGARRSASKRPGRKRLQKRGGMGIKDPGRRRGSIPP